MANGPARGWSYAWNNAVNRRRREGYLSALAEAGVAPHRDWIFEMDFTMDAGYKAGVYLSTLTERPTAICAANDVIANLGD